MTPEELKYAASVMLAAAEPGVHLHCFDRQALNFTWYKIEIPVSQVCWDWNRYNFRIAKPPTYRPWKSEEVPLGGRLRRKDNHNIRGMITHVDGNVNVGVHYYNLYDLFDQFEGTDGSPCGVLES